MAASSTLDYGRCPCGGQYERRVVEVSFKTRHPPMVLRDVPQGACLDCGSRVYKAAILERIEEVFAEETSDARICRPEIWLEAEMFACQL